MLVCMCKIQKKYSLKYELKLFYLYSRSSNEVPESQASHVFVLNLRGSFERFSE